MRRKTTQPQPDRIGSMVRHSGGEDINDQRPILAIAAAGGNRSQ
jgi:hypothetical protein